MLELTDNVIGGRFKTSRSDVAALELIVRQEANVRPPGFSRGIPVRLRDGRSGQQHQGNCSHDPVYGRANTTSDSPLLGFGSVIPLPPVATTATYCFPFLPR